MVYAPANLKVHYRSREKAERRTVALDDAALLMKANGIMLDMHTEPGEAKPFSVDANNRSIEAVVPGHGFLKLDRYVEKMKLGAE